MHDAMPAPRRSRRSSRQASRPKGAGAATAGSAVERFLALGEDALSTQELLSLLLGSTPSGARPRAAERLLELFGDLRRLAGARPGEVEARGGVESVEAIRLSAAFALGRRAHAARLEIGRALRTSVEIYEAFHGRLRDLRKERFIAVLVDARQRVMREDVVSEGILTASLVHPREVFAPAIRESAGAILLVHNHPSGDPEPSPEDLEITRRLAAVGELVGIRVLDHVVVGDGAYVSFRERGIL